MRTHDIIETLRSKPGHILMPNDIAAIYLYGSVVKGRLRADSDIDIAMLPFYDVDAFRRLELISKVEGIFTSLLREIGIEREVSILDLRDKYVSLQLQYNIITKGVLVYEKDTSERLEFENAVKREYFDFEPYLRFLREKKYGDIPQKA